MKLLNTNEIAKIWGISERRVRKLCETNMINGASKISGVWKIKENATKPIDGRRKTSKHIVIITNSLQSGETLGFNFIKQGYEVTLVSEQKSTINDIHSICCSFNDFNQVGEYLTSIDRIDSLIIFPSGYLPKTIDETTVSDFDTYSNLIVKTTYNTIKNTIIKIRKCKGNVIILHSSVSLNPEPGATVYSMLQSTLIMLGKALALREASFGVKVNNVLLGPANTDKLMETVTNAQRREWKLINPLGVTFKFEDCLDVINHLVVAKGSYSKMTGTVIPIDGGESIANEYTITQKGANK